MIIFISKIYPKRKSSTCKIFEHQQDKKIQAIFSKKEQHEV